MAALPALAPDGDDPTFSELLAQRPHLTMDAAAGLMMEEVPLATIARAHGTPSWVYSAGTLRRRLAALRGALDEARTGAEIHFAVKANPKHLEANQELRLIEMRKKNTPPPKKGFFR